MTDLFDDLRNESGDSMRLNEEEGRDLSFTDFSSFDSYADLDDDPRPQDEQPHARRKMGKGFLGMSAGQRFVLAFLLFILSLAFSSACLLITGRIVV